MATMTLNQLTLFELANRTDPKGDAAIIAEVLTKENPILLDAQWEEANNVTTHKISRRLTLPAGTWRQLNQGVSPSATQTVVVNEAVGELSDMSAADETLVMMAPNPAAFRMSEATAFIEGLGQTLAATTFYGNAATDPAKFTGIAPRLKTIGGTTFGNGGSGSDVSSIYAVQWGERMCKMIYPKGHANTGVERSDMGIQLHDDGTGKKFRAYVDWFAVRAGLAVYDDRCIGRVANIETAGTTNILEEDNIVKMLATMKNAGAGAVLYMNSTIWAQLQIIAKDRANVFYDPKAPFGMPIYSFRGWSVKVCDAILNTESAIS